MSLLCLKSSHGSCCSFNKIQTCYHGFRALCDHSHLHPFSSLLTLLWPFLSLLCPSTKLSHCHLQALAFVASSACVLHSWYILIPLVLVQSSVLWPPLNEVCSTLAHHTVYALKSSLIFVDFFLSALWRQRPFLHYSCCIPCTLTVHVI